MEGEVIKYFITQGAFAVLFMWLLIDTRKDSKQREEKYQQTIDKLADKINIVEDIKEDVEEIKNKVFQN
ncbi:BhlA/UviB family holin-like peptide [Clostridium paraputrificum]|uniref:BhlA/UviB family holin-like peptide n=1 Tax=Clostridium paraputrificum TaxID=29363 RepID=UPI000C082100|nr:BhlA/UviB family holin-like peptide [Clostridium paraputrificum]DAU86393.1 MAG TPA: holin family protein [Caudoviricetes sp.]